MGMVPVADDDSDLTLTPIVNSLLLLSIRSSENVNFPTSQIVQMEPHIWIVAA
ncbi:MAG: hypothetical protein ACAI44_21830 [Candidatus Sericytochromatia bacterium]